MDKSTNGQCLCGAVKFRIYGTFDSFFLCHCGRCRKDTGSAHAANLFASNATLEWLTGEENVRTFRLSGTRHVKSFCSTCGSALPFLQTDADLLVVPAGSLDTPVDMRPTAHICLSSRADWECDMALVKHFDGLPG